MGVGFKKYKNKKKIEICAQKKWETCLIWSFSAKMDQCTNVSHLSWLQLMLEIKHKKALLTCLKSTKICDLVYRQQLCHCMEQLVILEREEEHRWMEAALKAQLPETSPSCLTSPGWNTKSPNQDHPPTRSLHRTTNYQKICHISIFLLALLYLLNLLKTLHRLVCMIF